MKKKNKKRKEKRKKEESNKIKYRIRAAICLSLAFCVTVSQFTLYGILKGNKPDFHVAMPPERAKPFYQSLVDKFQKSYNLSSVKGKTSMPS